MNKACLVSAVLGMFLFLNLEAGADLVIFPTGPAAWMINVTPSQASAGATTASSAQNHIVEIDVTQDNEKRRSLITWSDGKTTERWAIPRMNLILAEDSNGQAFSLLSGALGAQILAVPFTPSSFSWISPEYLLEKDPVNYQGKPCFHYRSNQHDVQPNGKNGRTVTEEAWIDSGTLLPVALDDGTNLGIFTFKKDPPPPLTMQAKFQDAFRRAEEAMGIVKPVYLPAN